MRRGSHLALFASAYNPVAGRGAVLWSSSCTISRNDCDVAEQKMKKVPSFLLRRLLNCGRVPIFAPQSRTKASRIGRLAQLVQSVCLTSRGSGVRIPQRPHSFRQLSIGRWVAVFFVHERNCGRVGDTRKFGGRLCAKPASTGRAVVCFCVGMSVGCSSSCERVCAVVIGIWCHLLEKPIDEWRCSQKKRREKEKRRGKLSISSQLFIRLFAQPCTPFFGRLENRDRAGNEPRK